MSDQCDYCWRPAIAAIYLSNGALRTIFRRPRRKRRVCTSHLLSKTRRG